jgi:serine/threonine protein kinase
MGVVYKAYDPELDRHVALKVLKASASAVHDELVARLQREARAMAKLSHANVVTVHDVGLHRGSLYLAMELVQGTTLEGYIRSEKPPLSEILRCFRDVARGLSAAHEAGLVHRDLKPQNVLVSGDGVVKVTDFGLARPLEAGADEGATLDTDSPTLLASVTRTGQIIGTPAYMAPEQFLARATDAKTDVFAFGVALYEAICERRPFSGRTVAELRENVLTNRRLEMRPALGLAESPPSVLESLTHLVERCLAIAPENRPHTMRDVEADLQVLRSQLLSPSPAPAPPVRSSVRPRRVLWPMAALATLALAVFGMRRFESRPVPSATAIGPTTAPSASVLGSPSRPAEAESESVVPVPLPTPRDSAAHREVTGSSPKKPHSRVPVPSASGAVPAAIPRPRTAPNGAPILD